MSALPIAVTVFVFVFGAAMRGMFIGGTLPEPHLSQDSKDVVKLGTALIATMAALVLSLLISSAKNAFDLRNSELTQNAARILTLDRAMADDGPETKEICDLFKRAHAARIEWLFPADNAPGAQRGNAGASDWG